MAECFPQTKPFVSSWSSTPVPALSLSAAGLLALADLNTVAQRTIITGGSSWLDAFVLAPGLHYQQAAGALLGHKDLLSEPAMALRERQDASASGARKKKNPLGGFVSRRAEPAPAPAPGIGTETGMETGMETDWLSHVLYLTSPGLTLVAGTLMVLLRDWWGTALVAALVASRVLNIWSIKQRTQTQTQTTTWLRQQTAAESHLEAAAKLIVYLVAAFSGNQTQAGAMVLMALLLASAGLLGLSNARSRGLRMNGRVAKAEADAVGDRENGRVGGKLFEDLELN